MTNIILEEGVATKMLFESFILTEPDARQRLVEHKFRCGPLSFVDRLSAPYQQAVTERFIPDHVSPNAITLSGFFILVSAFVVSVGCGLWEQDLTFVFTGVAIFVYYNLDCIDGKHARYFYLYPEITRRPRYLLFLLSWNSP